MVNQQTLTGHWNEVRGKLKEKWGQLSDDDLRSFSGSIDQLVGRIQEKTGATRDAIRDFLDEVSEECGAALETAREKIQETAEDASDTGREAYAASRRGYTGAERVIQTRPGQSLAVAFGLGVVAGAGLAVLLRSRPRESAVSSMARGCSATEQFGRQILSALSGLVPESVTKGFRE